MRLQMLPPMRSPWALLLASTVLGHVVSVRIRASFGNSAQNGAQRELALKAERQSAKEAVAAILLALAGESKANANASHGVSEQLAVQEAAMNAGGLDVASEDVAGDETAGEDAAIEEAADENADGEVAAGEDADTGKIVSQRGRPKKGKGARHRPKAKARAKVKVGMSAMALKAKTKANALGAAEKSAAITGAAKETDEYNKLLPASLK